MVFTLKNVGRTLVSLGSHIMCATNPQKAFPEKVAQIFSRIFRVLKEKDLPKFYCCLYVAYKFFLVHFTTKMHQMTELQFILYEEIRLFVEY